MKHFEVIVPDPVTDAVPALPTAELAFVLAGGAHDLLPEAALDVEPKHLVGAAFAHPAPHGGPVGVVRRAAGARDLVLEPAHLVAKDRGRVELGKVGVHEKRPDLGRFDVERVEVCRGLPFPEPLVGGAVDPGVDPVGDGVVLGHGAAEVVAVGVEPAQGHHPFVDGVVRLLQRGGRPGERLLVTLAGGALREERVVISRAVVVVVRRQHDGHVVLGLGVHQLTGLDRGPDVQRWDLVDFGNLEVIRRFRGEPKVRPHDHARALERFLLEYGDGVVDGKGVRVEQQHLLKGREENGHDLVLEAVDGDARLGGSEDVLQHQTLGIERRQDLGTNLLVVLVRVGHEHLDGQQAPRPAQHANGNDHDGELFEPRGHDQAPAARFIGHFRGGLFHVIYKVGMGLPHALDVLGLHEQYVRSLVVVGGIISNVQLLRHHRVRWMVTVRVIVQD